MISSKKTIFLFLALLGVSACTNASEDGVAIDISSFSTPTVSQEATIIPESVVEETARLIVYKQVLLIPSLSDALINANLMLNGEKIGKCRFGQPVEIEIAPGTHVLESDSEFPNGKKFIIEAGETAYVQCKLGPGILVPNTLLEFVDEETGARAAARIRAQSQ